MPIEMQTDRLLYRQTKRHIHSDRSTLKFFSFGRSLTGRGWTAALFLIYFNRTLLYSPPFSRLLILLLLLVSGNVHSNPGPASVRPSPLGKNRKFSRNFNYKRCNWFRVICTNNDSNVFDLEMSCLFYFIYNLILKH